MVTVIVKEGITRQEADAEIRALVKDLVETIGPPPHHVFILLKFPDGSISRHVIQGAPDAH